jgi:hypothetical protein
MAVGRPKPRDAHEQQNAKCPDRVAAIQGTFVFLEKLVT